MERHPYGPPGARDPAEDARQRVVALLAVGRLEEAEGVARRALRDDPDDALTLTQLALVLHALERDEDARAAATRARAAAPDDPRPLLAWAELHVRDPEHRDDAVAAGYRAAVLALEDPRMQVWYARVLLADGDASGAAETAEGAISLDPEDVAGHRVRGVALGVEGRFEDAEQVLRDALQLDPSDRGARLGLARVLRDLGRTAEGLALLEELVRERPQDLELQDELREAAEEHVAGHGPPRALLPAGWEDAIARRSPGVARRRATRDARAKVARHAALSRGVRRLLGDPDDLG